MDMNVAHAPLYQGYIDERSTHHVRGWLRDLNNADARVEFEVVLPSFYGRERVLARGVADRFNDQLVHAGVGDGRYAFFVRFPKPLRQAASERVFVRPAGTAQRLELAPALRTVPPGNGPYQGFVDERSTRHVAGWVRDLSDPERRVEIELVLPRPDGEEILERCTANALCDDVLTALGSIEANYAFYRILPRALSEAERDALFVRVAGSAEPLALAPALRTAFEPIHHIAIDIVNNCNLRCPFCVYDYTGVNKTEFMTEATFDAFARLLPYVRDGNFWLSCLHEATMHPQLMAFIERVPLAYRKKIFFTTNLAKRMPDAYFTFLANCGASHVNISIESLRQDVYERMRKGARQPIFLENWDKLLAAFRAAPNPPKLRYNIMAYRSNLHEIPELVRVLLAEKMAWQTEVRHTFSQSHIQIEFQRAEFLTSAEWKWLEEALKEFPPAQVLQLWPPDGSGYETIREKPPEGVAENTDIEKISLDALKAIGIPRPFSIQAAWDGSIKAYSEKLLITYFKGNITQMDDPLAALLAL